MNESENMMKMNESENMVIFKICYFHTPFFRGDPCKSSIKKIYKYTIELFAYRILSRKYPSTLIDSSEYCKKSKVIFIKHFKKFKYIITKNLKLY